MILDVRLPLGLMFTLLGVVLAAVGAAPPRVSAEGVSSRIDLPWGLFMAVLGLGLTVLALRAARARRGSSPGDAQVRSEDRSRR